MKKQIASLLSITLMLSGVSPAFAQTSPASIDEISVQATEAQELLSQIHQLRSEIQSAQTIQGLTMWVGIPTSVVLSILGGRSLFDGWASSVFGSTIRGNQLTNTGLIQLGTSVTAAGVTVYVARLTSSQIAELQEKLATAEGSLNAILSALAAAGK